MYNIYNKIKNINAKKRKIIVIKWGGRGKGPEN